MAEARASQLTGIVEIDGRLVAASQLIGLIEIGSVEIDQIQARASQLIGLIEIDQVQTRASQALLLIEIEYAPPSKPRPGGEAQAQPGAAMALGVSARAAAYGAQAFVALAQSRATVQSGTILRTAAQSAPGGGLSTKRTVSATIFIDWGRTGSYINESARLVDMRGTHSLSAPNELLTGGRGAIASCSIRLLNHDGRFSANNVASPLFAQIGNGGAFLSPVRVDVTIDGDTRRVFTGVLREIQESAGTATQAATVTLECRGRDELLIQDKRSTPLNDFLSNNAKTQTEDFHIIRLLELAGLIDGVDFRSQAWAAAHGVLPTIDSGIFPIRYVWLDDESLLDEIWQLVAACCGWFYCDADGLFHYHNITAIAPAALTRQYGNITTLALDANVVAGLTLRRPATELYSDITVEVSARAPGDIGEIWKPDDVIVVQPGSTKTVWARLNSAQWREPTITWQAFTASGSVISSGVTVTPTLYAQRIKLEITNTTSRAAYLNVLRIDGQVLVGGRTLEIEKSSALAFWSNRVRRRRSIRNNIYIQSESQAETVAAYTLKRQESPTLIAQIANVDRHDVRLGWPVRIEYVDAVSSTMAIEGMVTALNWRVDNTGFRSDVTVLETGALFGGVAPFFVLGTHKLGATGAAGEAYLFY